MITTRTARSTAEAELKMVITLRGKDVTHLLTMVLNLSPKLRQTDQSGHI